MKKLLLIANWKANPASVKEAIKLFSDLKKIKKNNQEIIVCPPTSFLGFLKKSSIKVGAQNVSVNDTGPFTGEVTASMLKSVGVSHCIVGHSERRKLGENNEMVSEKIKLLLKYNITPILCVGEKERGQDGEHFEEITNMILSSVSSVPRKFLSKIIIAYEPLWAISTEKKGAMDPEAIHETIIFLKKVLNDHFGKKLASNITVIYGGSVDSKNSRQIVEIGGAKGFLIGKASLSLSSFKGISDSLL